MAATSLNTVFGNEIRVQITPRQMDREYHGIPGVNGVLSMANGTRGRRIIVTGRLRYYGANYATARNSLQATIDTLEAMQSLPAASYTYGSQTFNNVIFEKIQVIPDSSGKSIFYTRDGYAVCDFIANLYQLI